MASLNPSSIYTPTGHDGWRFHISLSVASTSGNNVTIKYSITTDRNGSSSSYIEVSATSFSINGTTVASRDYIGYGDMSDGMTVLSGTHTISGTSFSISFVGGYYWNTSHDCDISRTISVTGLTYTVTFDLAGGTRTGGGALTQTVTAGGNATPPTCKRTGYDFDGWSGSYTNVTSNRTITAQWSRSYYTVTFDLDGGTRTGGGALSQSVVHGGSATPPTCSRSGYTFAGWNGSYTNVTSDRTITARWTANTYTVTYNANGGTGAPASQTKVYGQNLTLSSTKPTASWTLTYNANGGSVSPTSKSLSRPFRTWNTRADGTGTNYAAGATYTGNAPLTLYAQYDNPTAGALPTPTRSNCTFNRWTTSQNSGSTVTSSTVITKNTIIYAFWNYGVFLRGNGGTITIGEDTPSTQITTYVAHGSTYTIPDCYVQYAVKDDDIPSRNFIGWSTASSGSIQYQNGSKLTITSVTSLYAIYQIKSFTVVFTDGFGTTIKTQIVQYGQNATPPSDKDVQAIARPGYTFTGNWLGNYTKVISDRTIIALWGFTPIWILKNGKWVSYQAKED